MKSTFSTVLRPFIASAFATGIPNSYANIAPLAIAVLKDGSVLASGAANRGSLYNFSATGGAASSPLTTLQYPIFDLATDSNGSLWATTGGGPLLQLDPQTGNIVKQYGDSITQALAIQTGTGLIYVSSGKGIEIFNPINETFIHYSDLRVDSLAFNADGKLWATTWPQRGDIVRFNDLGQPERILEFDSPVDSIAFGKTGSRLAGLLFVSNNNGDLQMVDLATLQHVKVASGGSRGENITTTDDGRVLLSQSHQIDIFNPVIAPKVAATNPAPNAIVALPQGTISVTFDQDMFAGAANDTTSVLNPANFEVVSASGTITPQSVRYDAKTRTVLLDFNTLTPDHYELRVSPNLKSTAGAELTDGYKEQFTAVSDFSALVDFKFTNPRSDRQHQTISYDVILTSKASSDLLLPVMLLLDPAQSFTGVPTDATRNASGAYMVDLKDNLPQGVLKAGQSTTAHTITVYNPDALRVEFTPGIYALPYPNLAPIITSAPVLTAYSGQSYNYQVAANDPDGAVLGYLLYDAPIGMSVDQNTGLITWSPTQQSAVSTDVTLQVYDLRGAHTTQSFTLNVVGGNHKPVFNTPVVSGGIIVSSSNGTVSGGSSANGTPITVKGAEGKSLQIKLSATDSDRNQLRYWADNLPNGAIFDSATGILTWTPGYEASGTYENVQFTVSDGIEKVVQTATIVIAPTNQAPTLIRPANTIVREGEKIRIQLQATDADIIDSISPLATSDLRLATSHLTYSSPLLPGGSQLDPRTGLFEWTPAYFQAGEFEIPFTVSDGESITTQTTKITVLNVNAAPVFDNLGAWQIQEGQSVRFRAFALDPDNPGFVPQDRNADGQLTILEGSDPSVIYTVSGLPTGATFDPITAMFAWTPGYANAGIYNVTFTATDDGNGTGATKQTSLIVPITVFNTNRAPAIAEFTNVTLNRGETRELVLRVSDADNDPLVLQLKAESTGYDIPDFVKFTDNGDGTATLRLTPGVSDGGNYSFTLVAADNGNGGGINAVQRDEYTFVVSVNAPNDAPKLPFIGNKVAVVGETLKFLVKASDRNQDNLNFNLSDLPAGATLKPTLVYGEALFDWTPTLADIGTSPVTIRVQDSGNGNSTEVLTSQQAFNLVVRTFNTAPILSAIANQTVAEGQTLTLALSSSDADGDTLTYSASNLPAGAVLDSAQGILTWTPNLAQAGIYNNNITVTASDGNKSSSQTFAILVNNTNQAPVLAPLPIQTGLENNLVQFTLAAGDIDNDSLIYSAVSPLPTGAAFDPRTGQFTWKPNYEQAGEYILRFAATDAQGASDIRDVTLRIANVNRTPAISVSPHAVALGETLQFTVAGTDPDNNTNLTYTAVDLPLGAVLDAVTGRFTWTPNPGQVGDYAVTYGVNDGEKTVTQTSLVRVAIAPTPPTVNFDLTPSFPAVPGQKVIVQTLANGLAAITNLTATVDGRPVTVDSQGRIEITPTTPGRLVIDVTATDADGRVGHNSTVVKVRDQQDSTAPIVAFAPGLDGALVKSVTNIIGSVSDVNLDSWVLEIADFGENVYRTLASGNGAVSDLTLAQFDPGKLENGFYQLRLRATDISDRSSLAQAIVEVNTTTKPSAYTRTETDLSITFSSAYTLHPTPYTLNLIRTYSSLNTDEVGSFGNGWQLAALDTNIQTNVPLTGRESLGVYEPFRVGTRLYLTTPTGERVGFTFAPQKHTIPGLTYYTPTWVADSGVNYTLSSADAKLTLAGNRFYDLKTGHAYNPGSGEFDGADYTLSSADGTVYHLSSAGGVTEQIGVNGTRIIYYSDSGITSSTGETMRFVKDAAGRLTQITAPDGSLVVYSYDALGNLVSARNLASGQASRYGYSSNLLTLATGTPGTAGEAIAYSTTPQVSPVLADLGSAAQFTGKTINDSVGESDRFTFSLRDSELRSTATGTVLLGVELQGNMALPTLLGLTPVATHLDANGSYALFAVDRAGLNLISLTNTSPTPSLSLFIAGDVNRDGLVDGVDSGLLAGAIASGNYNSTYDFNRDGVINATDVQILGSNYGFTANRAPVVTSTSVLTHSDLSTSVALDKLATDPEGDAIFYRIINPVNGAVTFTPDGHSAKFTPTAGYSGMASFDVVADDGFSSSAPAKVTVNVSNAALVNLDFARRGLRLDVGGSTELVVVGDFADQQDVILPYDYLLLASDNAEVAAVSTGKVTGLSDGVSVLSASRNGISAVTALRVGELGAPTNQAEFNLALAETNGLNVYPKAVTLVKDAKRQIFVGINSITDSPDLKTAISGTQYFISNPNILQVTPNGLITALADEGVANITVINGAAEYLLPVRIEHPHPSGTEISTKGGAVQALDGSMIMIAPNALTENATISIEKVNKDKLDLSSIEENYTFAGAFKVDVSKGELNMPVQLAIPNTFGIETGKEVFFMRKVQLPSDDGTLKTAWFIEESGIVGADGLIRTSSPPWKGVELLAQKDNEYTIVVPKFSYRVVNAQIPADWMLGISAAGIALAVGGAYIAAASPLIGGAAIVGGLGFFVTPFIFQDRFESSTEIIDTPDIVRFPVAGFPYPPTSTGVSLNLAQLSSQSGTPIAQVARPTAAFKASNTPTIDTLEVDFDLEGAFIRVTGQNLVSIPVNNQQNQENQQPTDKLVFDLQYAGKIYRQSKVEAKESNNGKQVFTFRLPNHIPVSEDLRVTAVRQVLNPPIGSPLEVVSQTVAPIFKHFDRVVATNPLSGNVKIMNALNAPAVVADSGSQNLLLANIPLGQYTRPRYSAALDDRIYVPLEGAKSVAVLDALGLRELDTNPDTEQIDRIKLPDGSTPSAIVFSPDRYYAYIADRNLGSIYVIDVNPNSPRYNEYVGTISVPDSNGIQQLSINSDGTLLFATSPSTKSGKGAISILNINPSDRAQQARGNVKKYNRVIQTVNTEPGVTGLSATENSNVMFFTNRYREAQGFGRLTLDRAPDGIISSHNIDYAQLQLGSIYDYFDVNEAYAVTMLRDQKTGIEYAFVAGRNGRQFGSGIESIDGQGAGSNVGIIRIAPGHAPELVAATRPIPMGLTSSLTLSDDNSYLYVANPGVNATFVYDVNQIIKTVETAQPNDLQSKPLDDINPLVGIATNIGQGSLDKNRPIGAGASWGTTSHAKDVQIISVQPDINSIPDADEPLRVIKFKFALNPQFNPQSENTNASTNSILDAIAEALIPPANAFQQRIPQSGRPSSGTVRRNVPGGTALPPTGRSFGSNELLAPGFSRPIYVNNTPRTITELPVQYPQIIPARTTILIPNANGTGISTQNPTEPDTQTQEQTQIDKETRIDEIEFYLSTFPYGEGLVPKDWPGIPTVYGLDENTDYNPNRIITAKWSKGEWTYKDINGEEIKYKLPFDKFVLPEDRMLTAGQTYHWAMIFKGQKGDKSFKTDPVTGTYQTPLSSVFPIEDTFSSVTIYTPGVDDNIINDTGELIQKIAGNGGNVFIYNATTGEWRRTLYLDAQQQKDNPEEAPKGAPLLLVADWKNAASSKLHNAGFAEAAADSFFAALVKLDQQLGGDVEGYDDKGNLKRKQGSLFNSPLHFIGHSQGAVINSEIVQRLGTFFPEAGGIIGNNQRDLQFTVVDPITYGSQSSDTKQNILDPAIIVWDNVTYADVYYQDNTEEKPFHSNLPNSTQASQFPSDLRSQYDWWKDLSNFAGFDANDDTINPHITALDWYTGTINLTELSGIGRYRRLGDLRWNQWNPIEDDSQTWYTPDHKLATLADGSKIPHGDQNAAWEGIGTGWFNSVLGGGFEYRPVTGNNVQRSSVSLDNTADPRLRGDYAIPTLFNGNFDAISAQLEQDIPGWNFQDSRGINSQNNLVSGIAGNQSYTLRLDSQVNSITHNQFVVPDWGVLRFDLFAPIDPKSKANFGNVTVRIEEFGNPQNFQTQNISLENALNNFSYRTRTGVDDSTYKVTIPGSYQDDIYRIGYGSEGFETFHIDVDSKLRGKSAIIKFQANNTTTPIYLDNVFFKSEALKWGNPTNARNGVGADRNNYLIEKPQYSLSYNESKGTANWVAWKVNNSWLDSTNMGRPVQGFAVDPELTAQGFNPLITDVQYESNYLKSVIDGSAILNWSKDEDGYYEYTGTDPLDSEIKIFAMADNGYSVYGYTKVDGERGEFKKTYWLNSDSNPTGEIYYEDANGNKRYYKSSSYQDVKSRSISPKNIFETDRGHLAPNADRSRNDKDKIATFLTSNLIPQQSGNNRNIWLTLEDHVREVSKIYPSVDTYVIAGGDGINTKYPLISSNESLNPSITVPQGLWKIVISENRQDNSELPVFARFGEYIGNDNRSNLKWDNSAFISSIGTLEGILNSTHNTSPTLSPKYDFFNHLPTETANELKSGWIIKYDDGTVKTSLNSSLLAEESQLSTDNLSSTIPSHNSPVEVNFSQAGIIEVGTSQVTVFKGGLPQIRSLPVSIAKVAASKDAFDTIVNPSKVGTTEIGFLPMTSAPDSISKISFSQNSTTKVNTKGGILQINTTEVNTSEQTFPRVINSNISKISLPDSISTQQFLNSNSLSFDLHFSTPLLDNIYSTVYTKWSNLLNLTNSFNLTFQITDLPTGQLAEAQITAYDQYNRPNGGTILIDADANGIGWFIDPTPADNSEFATTLIGTAFRATTGDAFGKYDLLTTILHETGHLLGIINGNPGFNKYIQTINGTKTFIGDSFTATLTPDGSHLDSKVHPYDLMNNTLAPGVRKLPSWLNLQILNAVRNNTGTPNSATQLTAPLTAILLADLTNGNFNETDTTKPEYGWTTRGAATILNSQAVLTEDSPLLSNFSQSFIIPEGAKYLQFTLKNTTLGANTSTAPGDAFEVALLNANTKQSLINTINGLSETDSLLNIQNDGKYYTSNKIALVNTTPNSNLTLNQPLTFKVDLTGIQAGTAATLYFDLLGFGARDAKVVLDNVTLLDNDFVAPVANNDTATTNQTQPVTINLLANDTDADSSINPSTLTIQTNPSNGAIALNLDGTVIYTPNPSFVGTDTFTYTITDTDGLTSNTATVNITVKNIAPVITVITGDTTTTEGTTANFSATAVDPGDELTYLWNFGDGSQLLEGQNVSHAYADNGTYIATLTVVDSQKVNSFQSLEITVNNATPKANAGANQSINEGQSVTFNGNFIDPGILDTHTYTWDFGDSNTVNGTLTPTHIYANNGTYTAKLTITDKDGGVSSDTLTVIVNNVAPTITQLTGTTEVAEGTPANFTATAIDPGNYTLTYTWNFGDGSAPVQGKDISHTFGDNGIYTVTLTVSDSDGASTSQTLLTKVNNVAATVNAGTDQTMYQNEPVIFDGQFHDPGILDTHTIEWNFGDGNTVTGVLNPNHIYTLDGEYTVTLTITDNSGAVTNDTMTVTVKKPPTMSVSDISIIEGDNGNKYAVFTANLSEASQRTITANYSTTDGTATFGSDYTATNGTISFASGEISKTITIQLIGDTLDEFDETFFVNLSDATNATILTNQATATILDDDAAPTLTIGDRTITEGDNGTSTITYTINLNTPSGKPVSVNYTTADGTATAGTDYTASNGIVSFAPGETSKTITVEVLGDAIDEFDETFFLNLSDATNATITKNQALSTIVDNDAPPVLTINDRTITEGDNGTAIVTFTVNLSAASAKAIAVNYATLDGTAHSGSDYTANLGTINFAPGETSKTISVQVLGDTIDEFDETFFLNLSNATNATIGDAQGAGTILDNDAPASITIVNRTITEADNGMMAVTYTVSLNAASGKPITVDYTTADGTATAGKDYIATSGILSFASGETSKTITVQVLGDTIDEFDENFFLNLSNASNATITNNQAVTTIIDNDAPPVMSIGDRTITEGHNGTQILNFTVSLNTASQKAISVKYDTANGTAIAGSDYTATSGTITFAPGETTKTVSVQIIGDRLDEQNENFFVNLSQAINANIIDAQAIGTIVDDDSSPTLTVTSVPGELWPPNHKMVEVKVNIKVSDDFDANPTVKLVSITSNELDNGLGDGDTAGDIEIRSDGRIFLRAERSGNGNGRIYTLIYSATDSAGNVTYSTTEVSVPKSQGK